VKGTEDEAVGRRVHRKHRHGDRWEHGLQYASGNFTLCPLFLRTSVTVNTHAAVKLKGRLVLIMAMVRATGLGGASLDRPETRPAPSPSEVKLWDNDIEILRVLLPPVISRYSGVFMSHAYAPALNMKKTVDRAKNMKAERASAALSSMAVNPAGEAFTDATALSN